MSSLAVLVFLHTAISLVAILAGLVVTVQLLAGRISRFWTDLFLIMAGATSVTGYFFPFGGVTPAQIVGVIALVILALVLIARHRGRFAGHWRWIYAAGMVASLYFLLFVLVVQAFRHVPALQPLAPTGSEPPFQIAQLIVLLATAAAGILATRRFRPALPAVAG